jgi:cation transport ATPase
MRRSEQMSRIDPGNEPPPTIGSCRRKTTLLVYGEPTAEDEGLTIEEALRQLSGVTRVSVPIATELVEIEYCPRACDIRDVTHAARERGVRVFEQDLHFHG